jgi:hypothetical protein
VSLHTNLLDDIYQSLLLVPSSITEVDTTKWQSYHCFKNQNGGTIGRDINRGRCPFVRVYRDSTNYVKTGESSRGGTVESSYIIEIFCRTPRASRQEENETLGYDIFEWIKSDLRAKNNWILGDERVERLEVDSFLYMIRANITVENSYPC